MNDQRLLGKWELVYDSDSPDSPEKTSMFIYDDGKLVYVFHLQEKDQAALMTYETCDGNIVTDQPSHSRKDARQYSFNEDGKLKIAHEGQESIWVKSKITENDRDWKEDYKLIKVKTSVISKLRALFSRR